MKGQTLFERFEDKFIPEPNSGCWLWTGSCNDQGYGNFKYFGRVEKAHRVAYRLYVGPIPTNMELDHLCRVPQCVNPAHLEPVTHWENGRRGQVGKWQLRKTHCPHGHPYSGENLYIDTRGRRNCKECRQRIARKCRAKRLRQRAQNSLLGASKT